MKINDPTTNCDGTYLQGNISRTYEQIVERLGKPMAGDGEKVDAQWSVERDGVVATLYNWKNGRAYQGERGTPIHFITSWNIGGFSHAAVDLIESLL